MKGHEEFKAYIENTPYLDTAAARSDGENLDGYVRVNGPFPKGVTAWEVFRIMHPVAVSHKPDANDVVGLMLTEMIS